MLVNFNSLPGLASTPATSGVEFPGLEPSLRLSFEEDESAPQSSFADLLKDAIGVVDTQHKKALDMAVGFAAGMPYDTHQVMIESAKSEALIHMASQVTSRVAQSYQTLMNMQI
ncbi:MAG TPA: flagellar hook-basal body complex protein FliE [Chroococcales cyanobacterium]|jgi:flagellar hook-basal body complex protein FliE